MRSLSFHPVASLSRLVTVLAITALLPIAYVRGAAVVHLSTTDLGVLNPATGSREGFVPAEGPFQGGEQLLVHVWVTADQDALLQGIQVDHRSALTSAALSLGQDVDTLWERLDGIPNFWFDYTQFATGHFPPNGTSLTTWVFADFSNLFSPGNNLPRAPSTFLTIPLLCNDFHCFQLSKGEPFHVGAMPVTLPAVPGTYTLDLLNASATGPFDGFGLYLGNLTAEEWLSIDDGEVEITYAMGSGPASFVVIPEPRTLASLLLPLVALLATVRRP